MFDWVKNIIESIGYPGIALLMILENIFPPIPSEVIMPFAGFVTEQGELNFLGVIAAGTIGSVLGTLPFYYLGLKIGEEQIKSWAQKYGRWIMLNPKDIDRATRWFERHDASAVFLCRLIPGIRTLISIPAGVARMNFFSFLSLSVAGTTIWIGLLTYLGQILGRNYDRVQDYLDPVGYAVFGIIVISYIYHIVKNK
ncbi:DedA family protein [Rhodohalobacter sulfatireducens]|uniref:DedA family protein n=1 Tax=Rhodohalobacter sulfatireducens TaxID=2911366 RepID=A0ABS9K820_9BACT|nr:DedA family protein [Rhodohalobacter sulfatireducens]MCG2586997.1 DedA family protein [Rhodohalobacter sulfatireducens]MDR9363970.1 DedA family protein [Balneolaceae bacterium]MDR9407944.1 DedA family protein [Balneolaceae bacterium]